MTSKIVVNNIEPDAGISTVSILGIATATKFVGDVEGGVTGNVTGNVTGSSGSCTGNAATATVASGITTTASVNTSGIVTATAFVPSQGQLSHRNLIINGGFLVFQRTSAEGNVGASGEGYFAPDRFRQSGTGNMRYTASKSTDVPAGYGFSNSLKYDCTTASGTVSAGHFVALEHRMEGQDVQVFCKGTAQAKQFTISFHVKSPKTGIHVVELYDNDNDRHVSKSYTISSANTWQKITLTFPGDTTGAFGNDNGASLRIFFWLMAGTSYTGSTLPSAWTGFSSTARATGQVNVFDSASNDFYITGIQLEVGPVATPFEHRSVGDELRRCYRYFQRRTSSDNYQWVSLVSFYSASEIHGFFDHYETMRAIPTLSATTGSNTLAVQRAGGSIAWSTGIVKNGGDLNVSYFYRDGVSLGTSGQCGRCLTWTAGCTITLAAEL